MTSLLNRCLFVCLLAGLGLTGGAQRPNIILIIADDLGYADLSCYDRNAPATPNLDQLAEGGVRFLNAYAASVVCRQSQLAILTGQYPARNPPGLFEIPSQKRTGLQSRAGSFFPDKMRQEGYQSFFIGRWDPGVSNKRFPQEFGFDYFFGFRGEAIDYYTHHDVSGKAGLIENRRPVEMKGYTTELFTQKALDILRMDHSSPFLICLYYNAPHWPWQAPEDTVHSPASVFSDEGGDRSIHTRMVKKLDEGIGDLLQVLEDEQLENNTLILFSTDGGGTRLGQTSALSGSKPSLQEGGIRVPAMMRWPGMIAPHTVSEQSCISMDWSQTILAVVTPGQKPQETADGINLLPYVTGQRRPLPRSFCWRVLQPGRQQAVREGFWKYLKDETGEHLFNLLYDPGEKNDRAEVDPELLQRLREKFAAWERTVQQPESGNTGD